MNREEGGWLKWFKSNELWKETFQMGRCGCISNLSFIFWGFIFPMTLFHSNIQNYFTLDIPLKGHLYEGFSVPSRWNWTFWWGQILKTLFLNTLLSISLHCISQPSCIYMGPYYHTLCHFWDRMVMRRYIFSTLTLPISQLVMLCDL